MKLKFTQQTKRKVYLLLPVVVLICILSVYPILRGIYLGFTTYQVGKLPKFSGFSNYIRIYESGYLITTFKNLAFMMIISLLTIYFLSMVLSLLLNSKIPLRGLWRTLLIIPWAVPPIAKIAMWRTLFNPIKGHINYILLKLGFISQSISWASDKNTAIYTVICVLVWGCIPFLTLSLLATLQQIPTDISEAAALDGANPLQYFRYVTLPYLNQTTIISMSLIAVWIMNDFPSQFLLTNGGPGSVTLTPIVEAYKQGFKYGNFGYASAYGDMMIFVISILLFFYIKNMNAKDRGVN